MTLIIAYAIMFGVGALGLIVPTNLFIIVLPFFLWLVYIGKGLFFTAVTHGVVLGLIISIVSTPLFALGAAVLFLIGRLAIDIPHLKLILTFKKLYDNLGAIYIFGYTKPLEKMKELKKAIKYLMYREMGEKTILKAYALGYSASGDEDKEPAQIVSFMEDLIKESV